MIFSLGFCINRDSLERRSQRLRCLRCMKHWLALRCIVFFGWKWSIYRPKVGVFSGVWPKFLNGQCQEILCYCSDVQGFWHGRVFDLWFVCALCHGARFLKGGFAHPFWIWIWFKENSDFFCRWFLDNFWCSQESKTRLQHIPWTKGFHVMIWKTLNSRVATWRFKCLSRWL